jgi:hypothetical protein
MVALTETMRTDMVALTETMRTSETPPVPGAGNSLFIHGQISMESRGGD